MSEGRRTRARVRASWARATALAVALLALSARGAAAQSNARTTAAPAPGRSASKEGVEAGRRPAPPDTLLQADQIEEALRVLEERLERAPDDFEARRQAARDAVYLGVLATGTDVENGWFRRGLAHADRALAARPDDREALRWALAAKGNLAVQTGLTESARLGSEVWTLAQHVLALDPAAADAHYALGKLEYELLKLNRMQRLISRPFRHGELTHLSWADALAYAQRAVELDPNDPLYRLGLADTLWKLDRHPESIAQLEIARELPLRAPVDRDFRDRAVALLDRIAQGIDPTK